jgi:SAM-dependent methyltransferase
MTRHIPPAAAIDEMLEASAPLQLRLAGEHCSETCDWYHGPRGYLRALGITGGIGKDTPFLLRALADEASRLGAGRVLICGAADAAMLAHVAAAFASAGQPLRATLVDRCPTPLFVNAWYAERNGIGVETARADILEFTAAEPFDLICTHSFFSFFEARHRPRLVERWRDLLRPGGSVITAHGLYATDRDLSDAEAERAAVYDERLGRVDEGACGRLGVDRAMLRAWIDAHNARKTHIPLRSVDDLRALFESGGFRLREVSTAGVSRVEGIRRVRVVAERLP